jgi:hypothetical protein
MGKELAVDMQLAHAARDQLGELAPEVQDDDRVGLGWHLAGPLWRGRVERLLEVRLDLGVVRGEDPVTRVRCLAVNGPTAARRR